MTHWKEINVTTQVSKKRKNLPRLSLGFTFSAKKVFEWIIRIAIAKRNNSKATNLSAVLSIPTYYGRWRGAGGSSKQNNIKLVARVPIYSSQIKLESLKVDQVVKDGTDG